MPFKIVRNDITRMTTEAIVNTANEYPEVGAGCDIAVYRAAGYEELLLYRKQHIGRVPEGEAFLTPGFRLPAKYIIHAVSPLYKDGGQGEEEKLRSCYRSSLAVAVKQGISSVSFPLISTGSYGYPKEEGMRIAIDEIHSFLLTHDMMIYLVVFGDDSMRMGLNINPRLEAYIDRKYVSKKWEEEYASPYFGRPEKAAASPGKLSSRPGREQHRRPWSPFSGTKKKKDTQFRPVADDSVKTDAPKPDIFPKEPSEMSGPSGFGMADGMSIDEEDAAYEELDRKLEERIAHMSDTFSQYLMFLISQKGLGNADVYKRAIVDKKVFSKIKNNPDYHPDKSTALRLCIGAMLNMDESIDLLQRAGYALSPCDKIDIIFSFFIENGIYNMIEIDIQLEEHGLPCIIA